MPTFNDSDFSAVGINLVLVNLHNLDMINKCRILGMSIRCPRIFSRGISNEFLYNFNNKYEFSSVCFNFYLPGQLSYRTNSKKIIEFDKRKISKLCRLRLASQLRFGKFLIFLIEPVTSNQSHVRTMNCPTQAVPTLRQVTLISSELGLLSRYAFFSARV